jgi:hypothetical protein
VASRCFPSVVFSKQLAWNLCLSYNHHLLLPPIKSMISLSPILIYFQLSTSHFNFLHNLFYTFMSTIFWAIIFFLSFCKYVCPLQFELATCLLLMSLWIVSFTYKLVNKVEGTSFFYVVYFPSL